MPFTTLTAVETFGNNDTTTLAASMSMGATVVSAMSIAGFPTDGQFRLLIDAELMLVTAYDPGADQWQVIRGVEGTTATSHAPGAAITAILTRGSLLTLKANIGVEFDGGAPAENLRSSRASVQSPIDNTKQGIVNLGSDTAVYFGPPGDGVHGNYSSILGGDQNAVHADYSHVVGFRCLASGSYSFATGDSNVASDYSFVAGFGNSAQYYDTAFGDSCSANGGHGFVFGLSCQTLSGQYAFAGGSNCQAWGSNSVALGDGCTTGNGPNTGRWSFAMGNSCQSLGNYCTAIGNTCFAGVAGSTTGDVAMGENCSATGGGSFAAGSGCVATSTSDIAMGSGSTTAGGGYCTAIGSGCTAGGGGTSQYDVAMGNRCAASGGGSVAMGSVSSASNSSIAIGQTCSANGYVSVAIGFSCDTNGAYGVALGCANIAGNTCFAVGYQCSAQGQASIAMGYQCSTSGDFNYSAAIGNNCQTNGDFCFATGDTTNAWQTGIRTHSAYGGAGADAPDTTYFAQDFNGAGTIFTDSESNELTLQNGYAYSIRVRAVVTRQDAAGVPTSFEFDVLCHVTGGILTIDDLTPAPWSPKDPASNGYTVVLSADGTTPVLHATLTGAVGQLVNAALHWDMVQQLGTG